MNAARSAAAGSTACTVGVAVHPERASSCRVGRGTASRRCRPPATLVRQCSCRWSSCSRAGVLAPPGSQRSSSCWRPLPNVISPCPGCHSSARRDLPAVGVDQQARRGLAPRGSPRRRTPAVVAAAPRRARRTGPGWRRPQNRRGQQPTAAATAAAARGACVARMRSTAASSSGSTAGARRPREEELGMGGLRASFSGGRGRTAPSTWVSACGRGRARERTVPMGTSSARAISS